MTTDAGKRKADAAKEHHRSGKYDEAIESYVRAAYEYLGAFGLTPTERIIEKEQITRKYQIVSYERSS